MFLKLLCSAIRLHCTEYIDVAKMDVTNTLKYNLNVSSETNFDESIMLGADKL